VVQGKDQLLKAFNKRREIVKFEKPHLLVNFYMKRKVHESKFLISSAMALRVAM
jgi:hypothetical protein